MKVGLCQAERGTIQRPGKHSGDKCYPVCLLGRDSKIGISDPNLYNETCVPMNGSCVSSFKALGPTGPEKSPKNSP